MNSWLPFISYTSKRTFSCGIQPGLGSLFAMRVLPFTFDFKSGGEVHSVVLVISPLVSLMVEQVGSLRKHGVSEAILTGNQGIDKCRLASEKDFEKGRFSLLFSASEAIIGSDRWGAMLLKPSLCGHVVAVNEAHCVSKW